MTRRTLLDLIGTGVAVLLAVLVLWAAEPELRPPAVGELGLVLVRGTATLVDDREQEHRSLDGSFTLYVLRESEEGEPGELRRIAGAAGRRSVRVRGGRLEARVAADARLYVRALVLGETATLLEPFGEGFALPKTRGIDLLGRALYPKRLRVLDEVTGRELSDVRVLDYPRIQEESGSLVASLRMPPIEFDDGTFAAAAEFDSSRRPVGGIKARPGELAGRWLRGASPILVSVEAGLTFRSLVVHVPGYALGFPDLDHISSEEVRVPPWRSGTSRIRVAACLGTNRTLRVARPDAEPRFWWLNAPLPAARATIERDDRHAWYEAERGTGMEVVRGARGDMTLTGIPAVCWKATLTRGDGEESQPFELDLYSRSSSSRSPPARRPRSSSRVAPDTARQHAYRYAGTPVSSCPSARVWMSCVPS